MKEAVENAMQSMQNGLVLITRSTQCQYHKDFYLYAKIRAEMQVKTFRNANAELVFHFYNTETNEIHAEGHHQIVSAGPNHKICKIPENFLKAGREYSVET